ncbi:MAG: hypothetical protein HQL27_01195 [Candidatus Omnitrophica bacterium]|nr:hypothetical protein [Candidatus Omnitrophota bacterium]
MIKVIKHLSFRLFLLIILLIVALSIIIQLLGKSLLESFVSRQFDKKISIGYLFYRFPFGLTARNVSADDFLRAKTVNVYFDFSRISRKEIVIDKLILSEGTIIAVKDINGDKSEIKLNKLNLILSKIPLPLRSEKTKFVADSVIEKGARILDGSLVKGGGWVDLNSKNSEGKLFFYRGKSPGEFLIADFVCSSGKLKVEGELKLEGLTKENISPGMINLFSRDNYIFRGLNALGLDVKTRFSFETGLDDFKIDNIAVNGEVYIKEEKSVLAE